MMPMNVSVKSQRQPMEFPQPGTALVHETDGCVCQKVLGERRRNGTANGGLLSSTLCGPATRGLRG